MVAHAYSNGECLKAWGRSFLIGETQHCGVNAPPFAIQTYEYILHNCAKAFSSARTGKKLLSIHFVDYELHLQIKPPLLLLSLDIATLLDTIHTEVIMPTKRKAEVVGTLITELSPRKKTTTVKAKSGE